MRNGAVVALNVVGLAAGYKPVVSVHRFLSAGVSVGHSLDAMLGRSSGRVFVVVVVDVDIVAVHTQAEGMSTMTTTIAVAVAVAAVVVAVL